MFDPSWADSHANTVDHAFLDGLITIDVLELLIPGPNRELAGYLAACAGATFDHADVDAFTIGVLGWWANNHTTFPTWAHAMKDS